MSTPTNLTPGPSTAAILAAARFDTRQMLGNGEQLLLTMFLPLLALIGLTKVTGIALPTSFGGDPVERIDLIAPGVLALAMFSTAFTGQAIATGFDRRYGVLRFLATTPLGISGFVTGRIAAVIVVQLIQLAVLTAASMALGWRPGLWPLLLGTLLLLAGSVAFVSWGLLLAGTMSAELVLALANILWVLLAIAGGLALPAVGPQWAQTLIEFSPTGAFGHAVRTAFITGQFAAMHAAAVLIWSVISVAAVGKFFRWFD